MKLSEVFTPNDTPTVTYVDREEKHEEMLRSYYELNKMVVSISGPSKSGKTVLINRVIPDHLLIPINGASISHPAHLWELSLQWMGISIEKTATRTITGTVGLGAKAGGSLGIPALGGVKAEGTGSIQATLANSTAEKVQRNPLDQVVKEIGGSDFAIFIDDFHYIPANIRDEVGKQIKSAIENGVKVFIASVPHRVDDVVRSNTELSGRTAVIDIGYWKSIDLKMIITQGFDALNTTLDPNCSDRIVSESFGSPQLVQTICFNLCYLNGIREAKKERYLFTPSATQISEALLATSRFSDFSKMVFNLQTGPKERGTERKEYPLRDGTNGDVYRIVLLALQSDPPALSFSYDEIQRRIKNLVMDKAPPGSSVMQCLSQMQNIADATQPKSAPLAWDDNVLDIVDPYFLFYLRCSDKLSSMTPRD